MATAETVVATSGMPPGAYLPCVRYPGLLMEASAVVTIAVLLAGIAMFVLGLARRAPHMTAAGFLLAIIGVVLKALDIWLLRS